MSRRLQTKSPAGPRAGALASVVNDFSTEMSETAEKIAHDAARPIEVPRSFASGSSGHCVRISRRSQVVAGHGRAGVGEHVRARSSGRGSSRSWR